MNKDNLKLMATMGMTILCAACMDGNAIAGAVICVLITLWMWRRELLESYETDRSYREKEQRRQHPAQNRHNRAA